MEYTLFYNSCTTLFIQQLSFFGWEFLSVFTMGILSIWLQPYIIASEVIFMNEITKNKK